MPLTPAQQAASLKNDAQVRDRSPKQTMALIYLPESHGSWAVNNLMDVPAWVRMSAAQRDRVQRTPEIVTKDWRLARSAERAKIAAATFTQYTYEWPPAGLQRWRPIGFGHGYIVGQGTCEGNRYWVQNKFDIDRQLPAAPRQADGTVLVELYGYKLSDRSNNWRREFVVLRYRICHGPFGPSGHCT